MINIRKFLFVVFHSLFDLRFIKLYNEFKENNYKPYNELIQAQEKQLAKMILYCYKNVKYYNDLFDNLNIDPNEIKTLNDLKRLPILTKDIINNNWNEFKPSHLKKIKYYKVSTGGTTGTPFKYRICKNHRLRNGAIAYRGWNFAGYELGDKVVFVGGTSIDSGSKYLILRKIHKIFRNVDYLTAFNMSDESICKYIEIINKIKPLFIYGYPSGIGFIANYILSNNISINTKIKGVFTTSELLQPYIRDSIEKAFNTNVYDGYGLNDGGVTANECELHNGLHIDTENAIMEIIDDDGNQITNGIGKVIATSLYNYAMPFLRYETGDYAEITSEVCSCGRSSKLLKRIIGREVDILKTPDGNSIHGWFFLYIFWQYGKSFKQYQVVQENINQISIKVVKSKFYDPLILNEITKIVNKKVPQWEVSFEIVHEIEKSANGKLKFIINNIIE